jgi:hypothetical protein
MKPDCIRPRVAFSVIGLLAFIIAGHVGSAIAQTPNAAGKKLPSGDPCTTVALPDVQKAFPGAKPGIRSTRVEKYGLTECAWNDGGGQLVLSIQEFYGSDSAMNEAKGAAMGFGAAGNVKYEILTAVGLGNEAVAFVETRDGKRGIVSDGAMLVLHRGQRTLFLASPKLQERDRAAALKSLEELGRVAAKRLD